MCIIVEKQTKEWKELHHLLITIQANHDRYCELYGLPEESLVNWDELDKQAKQATLQEIEEFK